MNPAWIPFVVLLAAAPFWESKTPAQWSDAEIRLLLSESPWAHPALSPGTASPTGPVQVRLSTAEPIHQAEQELERRAKLKRPKTAELTEADALAEEYREWFDANRSTHIVLSIYVTDTVAFSEEKDVRRMEDACVMRVGRKKIPMTGHFPPTPGDPYLRLAFPREVQLNDKKMSFELYVPGVSIPYRTVEFSLPEMVAAGKLEL